MDKHEYLARIDYRGDPQPSPASLAALQEAHLLSVPFENLDILAGVKIVLALPELYRKIVVRKRGGFCYELNGLFHWLLQELGFDARLAMGRVYDREKQQYGPEFDHMLILAGAGGRTWIADVGFGDFSMHPLEFTLDRKLTDMNGTFLIEKHDMEYFRVSRFSDVEQRFLPAYIFSTKERRLEEFDEMCRYHQTSPQSHFTQKRVCSLATASGRITLTDDRLIFTASGVKNESAVAGEEEFQRALATYFKIIR